jgi:hypothetical protein
MRIVLFSVVLLINLLTPKSIVLQTFNTKRGLLRINLQGTVPNLGNLMTRANKNAAPLY